MLHLFADLAEKGIAAPSADDHDDADCNAVEAHGHGGTRLDGVGAHFVSIIAKDILAKEFSCLAQGMHHCAGGDGADGAIHLLACVDIGGPGGAGVGPDVLNNGGPGGDWAQVGIVGAVHGDCVVLFVILL